MSKVKNMKKPLISSQKDMDLKKEHVIRIAKVSDEDNAIIDEIIAKPSRAIQLFKKSICFKALKWEDYAGLALIQPFLMECVSKDIGRWSDHFFIPNLIGNNLKDDEHFKPMPESALLVDYLSKKIQRSPFIRIIEFWLKGSGEEEEQQISFLTYLMRTFQFSPEEKIVEKFAPFFIAYLLLDKIDKYYGGFSTFKFNINMNLEIDLKGDEHARVTERIHDSYRIIAQMRSEIIYSEQFTLSGFDYINRLIKMGRDIDSLKIAASGYRVYRILHYNVNFIDKEIEINKEINKINKKLGDPHFSFLWNAYYTKATSDANQVGNDAELLGLALKEAELIDLGSIDDNIRYQILYEKTEIKKDLGLYQEALIDINKLLEETISQSYYYLKADLLFALNHFKEAESVAKKIPDGDPLADERNELLLKIYQQLNEPDKQYRTLQEIEDKHGFDSIMDEYLELVPDLVEQVEWLKKKGPRSKKREIEFIESSANFEEGFFLELLFTYQKQFSTFNGLSDKDLSKEEIVDYDILFLHMVFIKRICDSKGTLAEKLSLPKWNVIVNDEDISGSITGVFDILREYFEEDGYFDLMEMTRYGTDDLSKANLLRKHHIEDLIDLMNEYVWSQELIDGSAFYNAFKTLGYSMFDREEFFHNHQTKPEIVDLLIDLYDIESNDVVLDPACGTGRIFEKIISSMNELDKDIPYLYGFEEIYRVASFHNMISLLSGNERHVIKIGEIERMEEIPEDADYIFFDPPLDGNAIKSFFEEVKPMLSNTGKAIVIVPSEILSSKKDMWKRLIDKNLLDTIITLPKGYDRVGFGAATKKNITLINVPSSIVILDNSRSNSAKIRFFDASNPLRKMKRGYTNDHDLIITTLKGGESSFLDIWVTISKITEEGHDLKISHYLNKDDMLSEMGEVIGVEDIEKNIARDVIVKFAHIMNTSVGMYNNNLDPILKYVKNNISHEARMFPNAVDEEHKTITVQEQVQLIQM